MYNINRTYIFKNLYSNIYIARKSDVEEDSNHNRIATYEKPVEYKRWNIQYVKAQSELMEFGELASKMRVATIPYTAKYKDKFKEFDLAYLDGNNPNGEIINGQNANYRIYSVRPQNNIIKVYFLMLNK
jgi:hypothetical protein